VITTGAEGSFEVLHASHWGVFFKNYFLSAAPQLNAALNAIIDFHKVNG
jgi:hypothetical protein